MTLMPVRAWVSGWMGDFFLRKNAFLSLLKVKIT